MRKSNAVIHLSDAYDIPILRFLWLFKVATTATLAVRICPEKKNHVFLTYKRLLRLRRGGYIDVRQDDRGQAKVWVLTQLGYKAIREDLPSLKEDGFRCENIKHDYIVNAVQIGDWIYGAPRGAQIITEQQLRRCDPDSLEAWVPPASIHRPDGYWAVPFEHGHRIFALEVELSRKGPGEYQAIGQFYRKFPHVGRIVWIVKDFPTARMILKNLEGSNSKPNTKHNFYLLSDIEELGWQAAVVVGEDIGKTLSSLLAHSSAHSEGTSKGHSGDRSLATVLLSTRTRELKSTSCPKAKET